MIVCFGEALVDLVCERELDSPLEADRFVAHPGGALANVAVAATREGAEASLLGGVGDDGWGRWLRSHLEAEGVDLHRLESVEGLNTPVAFVTFDLWREPAFQVYGEGIGVTIRAAAGHLEEALGEAEALVFGSNTLVGEPEREITLEARRIARGHQIPILFDPNLRPHRWRSPERAREICREVAEGSFAVRANLDEARELTGERDPAAAAEAMCRLGADLGVVTLGPGGAVMRGAANAERRPPEVEVLSPLGAGDAFMGALAAGLSGVGWEASRADEALPAAVAAGARACTGWGAQV